MQVKRECKGYWYFASQNNIKLQKQTNKNMLQVMIIMNDYNQSKLVADIIT
jgi:hypothetical protein